MDKKSNNIRETVDILGVNIDKISMKDAIKKAEEYTFTDKCSTIYTPNSEIIMVAKQNEELKKVLNEADMLIPDGIGVVWASKINGNPVIEKVAGFDLMKNLLVEANKKQQKVFLFGGKPGIVEAAIENIKKELPNINFVGYRDGFFKEDQEVEIIEQINSAQPHFLFVALGAPKQEFFIHKYREMILAKVAMGVGGSFDIIAGKAKRAPDIFIKLGLEWFYRLIKEPWRFKRMLVLPKFGFVVIGKRFRRK